MVERPLDTTGNVLKIDCLAAATLYISQSHHVKPSRHSSVTIVTRILTGQQTNIARFAARVKRFFFGVFVLACGMYSICAWDTFTRDKAVGE